MRVIRRRPGVEYQVPFPLPRFPRSHTNHGSRQPVTPGLVGLAPTKGKITSENT